MRVILEGSGFICLDLMGCGSWVVWRVLWVSLGVLNVGVFWGVMVALATNSGGDVLFGDVQHRGKYWKSAEVSNNYI